MKWFGLLVVVLTLATLLFASPVAYADEPTTGESNIVIDISVTGTTQVCVTATDGSSVDVGAHGTTDAHLDFAANAGTVFDIYITGDGEADIDVSGPCEVNVKVEGPAKVNIKAGDEVKLNVEGGDESQVSLDNQVLDNPAQKLDEPSAPHQESREVDQHSSRLSSLAIISGAFPTAGLLAFFLVRRKRKERRWRNEVV